MRKPETFHDRVLVSTLALLVLAAISLRIASAGQLDRPTRGVAVCVKDFELSLAPVTKPDPPNPTYRDKKPEDLELRSRQLQDYFAETLVEMLRKQGYSSSRNQTLPASGILLEGVFAEPDQKNRIRRALLGSGSRSVKLTLYVGAFDQKNMNEPLYKAAPVQEPDPNYGPVITLNAYIPMARYEIAKEAGEEDMRKICGQIAADVAALLQRNPTVGSASAGRNRKLGSQNMPSTENLDTHRKAPSMNFDESTFGSFAGIGAGQELARWLLCIHASGGQS